MVVTESYEGSNQHDNYEGVNVHRYPFTPAALSGDLKEIRKMSIAAENAKKQFQPDIIHVHFNHLTAWFDTLSKNSYNVPSVITIHPPIKMAYMAEGMIRRILTENDIIATVSLSQKHDVDHFIGANTKTRVIYNGVPLVNTAALPLSFQPATVLLLGRMHETKGFDIALKACAKVLRVSPGSIKIIVAGDGPEKNNLVNLQRELGIPSEQIDFLGWVGADDVPDVLNQSSIVLMPSVWSEPFGLVAAQAAQMGRPVIGSNIGGIAEVIVNNETGLLVEPGHVDELADAIQLLISDTALAISLGNSAKKRADTIFTIAQCAAEYELLYQTIIDQREKSTW